MPPHTKDHLVEPWSVRRAARNRAGAATRNIIRAVPRAEPCMTSGPTRKSPKKVRQPAAKANTASAMER